MNGRLRSSVSGSTATATDDAAAAAATHDPSRAQRPSALPLLEAFTPAGSRQSPADWGYSSPSDYPSPSPRPHDAREDASPESSAQAAARFAAVSPHTSEPPRAVENTNDTFGRTSGHSAITDSHASSTRRRISPTERSAFGYLASSWIQPSSSLQSHEITEYLGRTSTAPQRQQSIDALQKELNLLPSSTPTSANSSSADDPHMWTTSSAPSAQPAPPLEEHASPPITFPPRPGAHTPDRTFGPLSDQQSRSATHSGASQPPQDQDQSRPSHSQSETTSTRSTDPSRDVVYGVGERGGDQQFALLTRTRTPNQQRQQDELDRMNQRADSATSSRMVSPLTTRAAQRASHQSNITVTGTSGSLASSSTPRHDLRLSRQTQDTLSPRAFRAPSLPEHDDSPKSPPQLFRGEALGHSSHESIDMLNGQSPPKLRDDSAPTRSASVRVKTPMFGNTLTELPPGQRVSQVGALHDGSAAPYASESQRNTQNARIANLDPDPHQPRSAQLDQSHAAANGQPDADVQQPNWHPEQQQQQQYRPERGYYMYQDPAEPTATDGDQRFAFAQNDDGIRTPHVNHLGDVYALAPKFPPAPYSRFRELHLPSRLARMHHTVLPLLTYAYIPATLFLDYNVIFAVVQIALHPDTFQTGLRTAWWIAAGIYGGCVLAWLIGVVLIYETLWSFRRRWTVAQPLVMPIYLSSPAFVRTAIKDYSLYSLLYRARRSGARRDALIESCWYYSQNWPTVLTLLPRAVIAAIILVLYKPSGPARPTQSPRDPAYFSPATQRLTQFAFIIITIQAAWVAWKLGVLLVAYAGLAATIGFGGLVQQEEVRNGMADTEMTSFAAHSRRRLVARQFGSQQPATQGWTDAEDAIEQAAQRPWAWRWRAEDRIRAILFDAGLLHHPASMYEWHQGGQHDPASAKEQQEHVGDRTDASMRYPAMYDHAHAAGAYNQETRDWFGPGLAISESQTGLALTSPEAVQPETWAAAPANANGATAGVVTAAEQQGFRVQHVESSPSDEGNLSDASDPYSPAPLPIGRSPRSKEQLRDASSISSRPDRTSSITSLNRLAALNAAHAGSSDSPHVSSPSNDDVFLSPRSVADGFVQTDPQPASSATTRLHSEEADDAAMRGEWRGRKRPRSSPVPANFTALNPAGMVTETEDWLRGQIDEEETEDGEAVQRSPRRAAKLEGKMGEHDRRVMHAFVPAVSLAMSKDPSLAGSPDQGGSDTKHGSWTAAAPHPELFAQKVDDVASKVTLPRVQPDAPDASTTSLGSSLKGRRSGTYSRPRSSGHGHEGSSEDGVSIEGNEARKRGRNSLLGRKTTASSETSRRSGSAGRAEGESWITSLFGMRSGSRKVSATGSNSSLKASPAPEAAVPSEPQELHGSHEPHSEVPVLMTTSASTTLPTADSGEGQLGEGAVDGRGSLLLAPLGPERSASPVGSVDSNASAATDDSDERRLWASFPDQTRRHPPGLIALDLEQRTSTTAPLNLSPLMHPNVLAAIGGASPMGLPGVLGGVAQLSVSPSEGGLHAIREESWSSSLDSRSQGATGSTRSRGTNSAFTASPVDADFPLEQIDELAVPQTSQNTRRRGST